MAPLPAKALAALQVIDRADNAARLLHPTRRAMLRLLSDSNSAVGLARQLGLPRQRVNYHLRELERSGVIELVEERRRGNCVERLYRASARAYLIDPDVIGALGSTPEPQRDRFSTTYLLTIAAEMVRDVAGVRALAEREGRRVSTLSIRTDIRFRSAADRYAFGEELAQSLAQLAARFHDASAPEERTFRLVAGCYPAATPPLSVTPDAKNRPSGREP